MNEDKFRRRLTEGYCMSNMIGGRGKGKTFNTFNTLPVSALLTMKAAGWTFKFDNALIVGAVSPLGWKWGKNDL